MLHGCKVSDFSRATLLQPSLNRRNVGSQALIRRYIRLASASSSASVAHAVPDLAVSERSGSGDTRECLADRLRLGSLAEDGFSYKERFIVRCYEVGVNRTATIETVANLLQEVACSHAQSVGFSTDGFATTNTMRRRNLIWVAARMHIEVYKYPAWADVVEIETWCQGEGKIGTRRDWILKDFATDTVIGRATSKWVMMNEVTRRLERVTDDVRDELSVYCPQNLRCHGGAKWWFIKLDYNVQHGNVHRESEIISYIHLAPKLTQLSEANGRLAFPEEDSCSLKKIPKLDDPAQHFLTGLMPRRSDFDMNQHVNNVTYIGWLLESMPQEVLDTHELQTITLDYRRECQRDDKVDSLTSLESEMEEIASGSDASANGSATAAKQNMIPSSQEGVQFLHFLRLSGNGLEINRGRTVWRRKAAIY